MNSFLESFKVISLFSFQSSLCCFRISDSSLILSQFRCFVNNFFILFFVAFCFLRQLDKNSTIFEACQHLFLNFYMWNYEIRKKNVSYAFIDHKKNQ